MFKALGLDLSTATELFYREAISCHGLPFDVKVNEPNNTTYDAMESTEKDEGMYGPFNTVAEMIDSLKV